jgi:PAS domain S-box-containing protein
MNLQFLLDLALLIIGWLGPALSLLFLALRANLPSRRGIGLRRIVTGLMFLLAAILLQVFWLTVVEPASIAFDHVSHALVAVGLVLCATGARSLSEQIVLGVHDQSRRSGLRFAKRTLTAFVSMAILLVAVEIPAPGQVPMVDILLTALDLSILAAIGWHQVRDVAPRLGSVAIGRARWVIVGISVLPIAGMSHVAQSGVNALEPNSVLLRVLEGMILSLYAGALWWYLRALVPAEPVVHPLIERDVPLALSRRLVLRRFVMLMVIGLFVVAGGVAFVSEIIRSNIRFVETTVLRDQSGVAKSVAWNLRALMTDLVGAVGQIAAVPAVREVKVAGMREAFETSLLRWGSLATHLSRVDARGRLVYTYPEMPSVIGADLTGQRHVQVFLGRPDTLVSDVFTAVQGYKAIAIYVPIKDEHGANAGAVAMLVRMNDFSRKAFQSVGFLNPNPVIAVNERGYILAGTDSSHLGAYAGDFLPEVLAGSITRSTAEATVRNALADAGSSATAIEGADGPFARRWVVAEPVSVGGRRWGVVMLVVRNADLLATYRGALQQQFVLWLLFTGLLLGMVGAVAFIFYRWSRFLESEVLHKIELVRQSEGKYRELFEESQDAIYMTTADGHLIDINPAGVRLFGFESLGEMITAGPVTQYYQDGSQRRQLYDLLSVRGSVDNMELLLRRRDGSPLIARASVTALRSSDGQVLQFRGVLRDVTQQKHLEEEIRQAQKMESIGQLAGGVAHDFNNLLGGVLGYATFMKSKLPADHAFRPYLETIERSAQRAADLTSKLLAFARGGQYDVRAVNLNAVIRETVGILDRSIDKSITVETVLDPGIPTIDGDAGQLQQVMMNLCLNGRDAMPSGGTLRITTSSAEWNSDDARRYVGAEPGRYVSVRVEDTGTGMDAATRQKIFEPFFTTKGKGKGTGLGLSMVYGIVRNHRGHIVVESEPGRGSVFSISFPAGTYQEAPQEPTMPSAVGGHERILVVDDEKDVRSMIQDVLTSAGYTVETVSDGAEAIAAFDRQRPDLILLDMIMPKMSGLETFDALLLRPPLIKVVLVTGYSQDGKAREIMRKGVAAFLQKPFAADDLLRVVRRVLDGSMEPVAKVGQS